MQTPVLKTERLVLRGHTVDDFARCCALWGDPQVTRMIGGRPSTPEEVWSRILRYVGHWQLMGYGYFVATDRRTGAVMGEFGLADFHRDIEPSFGGTPEAGWALLPQHQGKGIAREALSAVLAWADQASVSRTVCLIDPRNTPSISLATKLGYTQYAQATYKDQPTLLLARTSPAEPSG